MTKTDRQTDRQTGRQMDRQRNKHTTISSYIKDKGTGTLSSIHTAHVAQPSLIHPVRHRALTLVKTSELQAIGANTVAIGIADVAAIVAECPGWKRFRFRTRTHHSSRWSQGKYLVEKERK